LQEGLHSTLSLSLAQLGQPNWRLSFAHAADGNQGSELGLARSGFSLLPVANGQARHADQLAVVRGRQADPLPVDSRRQ
jgi:hypothetical protein